MEGIFGLVMLVVMLAVYFVPWIIAGYRQHPNMAGIAVLNVFLGWSLLGWVAALVWSLSAFEGYSRSEMKRAPPLKAGVIDPKLVSKGVQCPFCAEQIKPGAKLCRFCDSWLPETSSEEKKPGGRRET